MIAGSSGVTKPLPPVMEDVPDAPPNPSRDGDMDAGTVRNTDTDGASAGPTRR